MRWMLGFLVVAACGDGEHVAPIDATPPVIDGPVIDGPPIDGPPIDGPPIDGPPIDGPPIDAPIDAQAIDGPPGNIDCMTNADCPADRYCELTTASYCDWFSVSWCRPLPTTCAPPEPDDLPVCGCDGVRYATACDAHAASATVGAGGCQAPAGRFTCGETFCELTTEYCAELRENSNFRRRFFECRPMPAHTGAVCPQLIDLPCNGQNYPSPGAGESCSEGAGATHYTCVTIPF